MGKEGLIEVKTTDQRFLYSPEEDRWLDSEGDPAYEIPFDYVYKGKMRTFYFNTETRTWNTENGEVDILLSMELDVAFKAKYKLNGEVPLSYKHEESVFD